MSATAATKRRRDLERSAGLRRPLVLSAHPWALEQAQRLLPGRVLENLVEAAIADQRVTACGGGTALVHLGDGVVVTVKRTVSPLTGRRAWQPIRVRRP